jgi:hypothetical protein
MLKKESFVKAFPYIAAAVIFLVIILVYFSPVLDGKMLNQHDTMSWKSMAREVMYHQEKTGHSSLWTNSMFSGMPTYQIAYETPSVSFLNNLYKTSHLWLPETFSFFWIYLLCFFILLKAFRVNTWLSIAGSIAITFSSYFFIIIGAGHLTKAVAIGLMSAVVAGFVLIMRRQYTWGIIVTILFTSLGAFKHVQMTYYIFMLIGILAFAELWMAIKEKNIAKYFVSLGIFATSMLIGLGTNYTNYKLNKEYVKETMRGGHSELTQNNQENQQEQKGLDLEYATNWSYGIDETMTLLISNFKGGSSNYNVGKNSEVYNTLISQGVPNRDAENFSKNVPTYWGEQPFTSGPVYVGAIICFLFVLGLIIIKTPYKWALLFATIASIMLAWGKNFMPLTELFFNYFPMYNKFRAVSSILIIAEICMPLLGILAIKEILDKKIIKQDLIKAIYTAGGITAGICLFFALFGGAMYDFTSSNDAANFAKLPEWLTSAIIAERTSMLQFDAFRSFVFIILGAGTIWLFAKNKTKPTFVIAILGVFILVDMWTINRRYLNDDSFLPKNTYNNYFRKTPSEEIILQDDDPNFRVFNLAANTFNDSRTSYYLKSAGGYSAAKLRRYQDLIDRHLSKLNKDVLNMLNVKYFIVSSDNREFVISDLETQQLNSPNPFAMGNAWFVDTLLFVNTPDEEIDAMNTINLTTTAVADQNIYNGSFKIILDKPVTQRDSNGYIRLTNYSPDVLRYESNSNKDELAVFSEIFYPKDWKAYIDGKQVEIARVNYVLRAINIPAGKHDIRFEFKPDAVKKGEIISWIFIFLMFAITIGLIGYEVVKRRKQLQITN